MIAFVDFLLVVCAGVVVMFFGSRLCALHVVEALYVGLIFWIDCFVL